MRRVFSLLLPALLLMSGVFLIGTLSCHIEAGNSTCGSGTQFLLMQNDTGGYNNAHSQEWWWNTGWNARIIVQFNTTAVNLTLTNFPMLIVLNSSTVTYANFAANGNDIRFIDAEGSTPLPYEIESWNTSGNSYIWVSVPSLTANSTQDFIWMYYNNSGASAGQNATGVWGNNYSGVWHMNNMPNATAPQILDSSSNGNNGTTFGSMTGGQQVNGQVDGSINFTGANSNYVNISNQTYFSPSAGNLTVSLWLLVAGSQLNTGDATAGGAGSYFISKTNTSKYEWAFENDNNTRICFDAWQAAGANYANVCTYRTVNDSSWHYYTATVNYSSNISLYVDGSLVNSTTSFTGSMTAGLAPVRIGGSPTGASGYTNDTVDEVHLSNTVRTSSWIKANYLSMAQQLQTYGQEETPYTNSLCCSETQVGLGLTHVCSATFIKLYSDTNSHVEQNNNSNYNLNACINATNAAVSVSYQDNSCTGSSACMFSIANADGTADNSTNAHVAACGQYARQVCGTVTPKTVCINETGVCYSTVQAAVTAASAGQTVVILDNATYYESVTIAKSLTLTSNSTTGRPTIYGNNTTAITVSTNQLVISYINISSSGSASYHVIDGGGLNTTLQDVGIWLNNSAAVGIYFATGTATTINRMNFTSVNSTVMLEYTGNWTINNSRFEGEGEGVYSSSGMILAMYNSFLNTTVLNTDFGQGTMTLDNVTSYAWNGHGGIYSSDSVTVIRNSFLSSFDSYGLLANNNTYVENSTLIGGSANCAYYTYPHANNVTFVNTVLTSTDPTNVICVRGSDNVINISFINSTAGPTNVSYDYCSGIACNVYFKNYLDVYVNQTNGSAVSGATVNSTSVQSYLDFSTTTAATGYITRQNVTYANWSYNGVTPSTTYWDNHLVTASKNSSYTNASASVNMSTYQNITLTLQNLYSVCINETGVCYTTVQAAANAASAGQTVVITDNRTYVQNVTINKNLAITSNSTTGMPTMYGNNTSAINVNGSYVVNISLINVSIQGTATSMYNIYHPAVAAPTVKLQDMVFWTNATNGDAYVDLTSGSTVSINRVNFTSVHAVAPGLVYVYSPNSFVVNNTRITGSNGSIYTQYATLIVQNTFINNTDTEPLYFGPGGNLNASNVTLYTVTNSIGSGIINIAGNGTITNSFMNLTGGPNQGIYAIGSLYLTNVTLQSPGSGYGAIYALGVNSSVNVTDSTVTDAGLDLYVGGPGAGNWLNVTVLNSTILPTGTGYTSCTVATCKVIFKSYLDVFVDDNSGSGVSGATVNATSTQGYSDFNTTTASNGLITRQNITYANQTNNGSSTLTTYWNNHVVNASKNSTYVNASVSVNMTTYQNLTITLYSVNSVCVNETGVCWPTVQQAVNNATAGQTVVITDNRTYNENVTVNKNLTITSNSVIGMPTIYGNNNTTISISPTRTVTLSRLNLSMSSTTVGTAAVSTDNATVTITDSVFWVNGTGAIYGYYDNSPGVLTINRVNMTLNDSSADGIWEYNGRLSLNNTIVTGTLDSVVHAAGGSYGNMSNVYMNISGTGVGIFGAVGGVQSTFTNITIYTDNTGLILSNTLVTNSYINSSAADALSLDDGDIFSNVTFIGPNNIDSWATNNVTVVFIDSTMAGGAMIWFDNQGTNTVYNFTFINSSSIGPSNVTYTGCTSSKPCYAFFKSYVDAYVNDTLGNVVSGANVSGYPSIGALVNTTIVNVTNFTSTSSWVAPTGATWAVVEVWGGGGKGGTRTSNGAGGGGGGGAYSSSNLTVTAGTNYTVTVGLGATLTNANGGDSWFNTSSIVMAKGGTTVANNTATGGAGGLASSGFGNTKYNGGNGSNGTTGSFGGGGGGGAGSTGDGGSSVNSATGANGTSNLGGRGGDGNSSQGNGNPGNVYGGSGGGGLRTGSGTRTGGNGANGFVQITYNMNATVMNYSVSNTSVFSVLSNSSGYIIRQNVTYANQTNNGTVTTTTYWENHTINASETGYNPNSTSVNMSTYQNVTLTLFYNAILNVTLYNPSANRNVSQNATFPFQVNVSCLYYDCGSASAYLNPSVVNTTFGGTPFFTTNSNPQTSSNASCLGNMLAGSSCLVNWTVNATGALNTNWSFFAFANSTRVANTSSSAVNITIQLSPPTTPVLITPANNSTVASRYPFFNWSSWDPEGDQITYYWNLSSPTGCAAIPQKNFTTNNYTSIDKLCTDHTYNWTMEACDQWQCSSYASWYNFTIPSVVGIAFTTSSVNFGNLLTSIPGLNVTNDTLSNNPLPLAYNNTGNVNIVVTTKANTALWQQQALNTTYFQYADENSSSWQNWTASYTSLYDNLSYPPSSTRQLEVRIQVPQSEPAGTKNTTVTVLGASIE